MSDTLIEVIFEFFPVGLAVGVTLFSWAMIRLVYRSSIRRSKQVWRITILGSLLPIFFIFLQTQWWVTVVGQNQVIGSLVLNTGWTIFNTLVILFILDAVCFVRHVAMGRCQDIYCKGAS